MKKNFMQSPLAAWRRLGFLLSLLLLAGGLLGYNPQASAQVSQGSSDTSCPPGYGGGTPTTISSGAPGCLLNNGWKIARYSISEDLSLLFQAGSGLYAWSPTHPSGSIFGVSTRQTTIASNVVRTSRMGSEKATGTDSAMYVVGRGSIAKLNLSGNTQKTWSGPSTFNGVAVDGSGQAYSLLGSVLHKLNVATSSTSRHFDLLTVTDVTAATDVSVTGISINRDAGVLYFIGTNNGNKHLYGVKLSATNNTQYSKVPLDYQSQYNLSNDRNTAGGFIYIPCYANCRGLIRVKLTSAGLPDPSYLGTRATQTIGSFTQGVNLPYDVIVRNETVPFAGGFGMSEINQPQSAIVDTASYPQPPNGTIRVFLSDLKPSPSNLYVLEFGENDPCIKDRSKCVLQYCPLGSDRGTSTPYTGTNISASCCNTGSTWNSNSRSCVTQPPPITCPSGSTGAHPGCMCTNGVYNITTNSCSPPTCLNFQLTGMYPKCNCPITGELFNSITNSCVPITCPSPEILIGSTCIDISTSCSAIVSCAGGVAPTFNSATAQCECSSSCRSSTVRTRQLYR
jgi:hypothetical protein